MKETAMFPMTASELVTIALYAAGCLTGVIYTRIRRQHFIAEITTAIKKRGKQDFKNVQLSILLAAPAGLLLAVLITPSYLPEEDMNKLVRMAQTFFACVSGCYGFHWGICLALAYLSIGLKIGAEQNADAAKSEKI
jgi:hypothetical protein